MRVAITGGTGSFGTAFVERMIADGAERIVVVSRDEVKQGDMEARLGAPANVRFLLGDVRDRDRMRQVFTGCDVVIHAAALKRVSSVYSQSELVKTNVIGTGHVIDAALDAGVTKVVLISSDKAVEATNQYGVTKAAAEGIAVHANSYTVPRGLAVSVVRYGNVFGSRGSMIEVWDRQRRAGLPLTLTNSGMTRFLISLPQAVDVVLHAVAHMQGGEIYIPRLPAVSMGALVEALHPGYPTRVVGIRSGGEKMDESLLSREERSRVYKVDDTLWLVAPSFHSWTTQEYPVEVVPAYSSRADLLTGAPLAEWLAVEGCTV